MSERKNYFLSVDTLMHDPLAFTKIKGNNIYIPLINLKKLESLASNPNKYDIQAYQANEALNSITDCINGYAYEAITKGIYLKDYDVCLRIVSGDGDIFSIISEFAKQNDISPILISKKVFTRLHAESSGIHAQDYKYDKLLNDTISEGYKEINITNDELTTIFRDDNSIIHDNLLKILNRQNITLYPNEFLIVNSGGATPLYFKLNNTGDNFMLVDRFPSVYKVKGRNKEQRMAIDLLLDENINCIFLSGGAGTGKTLLSLALGLEYIEKEIYSKIILVKPNIEAGDGFGYLPGELEEKMGPMNSSFFDAFDSLMKINPRGKDFLKENFINRLKAEGKLEFAPIAYMRGRNLSDSIIIIDEAQGITPHIAKMLLTRAGENTKFIILGDPSDNQIDSLNLDSRSNGFVYLMSKFQGSSISAHIDLKNVVRSKLAALAEHLL